MRHYIKSLYLGIYVLFLLAVFLLFAVIQNASVRSWLAYLSIFIILATGSLLFWILFQKNTKQIQEDELSSKIQTSEASETKAETEENTIIETEELIDIQKLLPSRTLAIEKFSEELLQNMASPFRIVQGLLYIKNPNEDLFHCYAQYAYFSEDKPAEFRTGEALPGQAVKNKMIVAIDNVPDQYITVASGLGKSKPNQLVFVPVKAQDEVVGLIEYATFETLSDKHFKALEGISKKVADVINKHLKK